MLQTLYSTLRQCYLWVRLRRREDIIVFIYPLKAIMNYKILSSSLIFQKGGRPLVTLLDPVFMGQALVRITIKVRFLCYSTEFLFEYNI